VEGKLRLFFRKKEFFFFQKFFGAEKISTSYLKSKLLINKLLKLARNLKVQFAEQKAFKNPVKFYYGFKSKNY